MATNRYNGKPAHVETIDAGTRLYRIISSDASYAANSFNMNPRPLGDPAQGRFEPIDPDLGGYIYVAPSVAGAIAEGILRDVSIPPSGLVRRMWLKNKKIAFLHLAEDVEIASVHGRFSAQLNLDSSLLCCGRSGYTDTRTVGDEILTNTPEARGMRYSCRNHGGETSLILISRGKQPQIELDGELDILLEPEGRKLIFETLDSEFGLKYVGSIPGQHS